MLTLGRFVFLDTLREANKREGRPTMPDGKTYEEAGDPLAAEATWALATNDPAGFSPVDVLIWGSLGHIMGYTILALNSLQETDPAAFNLP